jgi:hypothetical protein
MLVGTTAPVAEEVVGTVVIGLDNTIEIPPVADVVVGTTVNTFLTVGVTIPAAEEEVAGCGTFGLLIGICVVTAPVAPDPSGTIVR